MVKDQKVNEAMTFEAALSHLEEIVNRLEQGDLPLEESLQAFQKGVQLSQYCQKTLKEAETTLAKMMTDQGEVPLDEGAG